MARSHAVKSKQLTAKAAAKPAPKSNSTATTADGHPENALESSASEVRSRLASGCICQGKCYIDLQAEAVYRHRLNIAELTKPEHDMYLMGVTMASLADRNSTNRHKERVRQRATYVFQGKRVCLDAFLYLENVTQYHLKRIRRHVMVHGVVARVHGNMRKKPHNALPLDFYKYAENYVKTELLHNKSDIHRNYVPVNVLRMSFYQSFRQKCEAESMPSMSYSTFRHFMKKQFPKVRFRSADDRAKAGSRRQRAHDDQSAVARGRTRIERIIVEQATATKAADAGEQIEFSERVSDNEQDDEYCIEYIENDQSDGTESEPDANEDQIADYLEYSDNDIK